MGAEGIRQTGRAILHDARAPDAHHLYPQPAARSRSGLRPGRWLCRARAHAGIASMKDTWQPIMFAPRDGTTFVARGKSGKIFGCRYNAQRQSFVNTATNHRVSPYAWRPTSKGDENVQA